MPNDFTPLSHEELRELWAKHGHQDCDECRAILSAVWWMANADHQGGAEMNCPDCQERFASKLTEIGIEIGEGKDGD